jgi:hypothetical protein
MEKIIKHHNINAIRLPRKKKKAFKIFLWEQTVNLKRKYFGYSYELVAYLY